MLLVKNLASDVTEQMLGGLFAVHGDVSKVQLHLDSNGGTRRAAYVVYTEPSHAAEAMTAIHGTIVRGSRLGVAQAADEKRIVILSCDPSATASQYRTYMEQEGFTGIADVRKDTVLLVAEFSSHDAAFGALCRLQDQPMLNGHAVEARWMMSDDGFPPAQASDMSAAASQSAAAVAAAINSAFLAKQAAIPAVGENACQAGPAGSAFAGPQNAGKGPIVKVQMCKFYDQGKCSKGGDCTYAHSAEERQEALAKLAARSSAGKRPADEYETMSKRMRGDGFTSMPGINLMTSYNMPNPIDATPLMPFGMNQPSFGQIGSTPIGLQEGKRAPKTKVKMCNFFVQGKCTKGDKCTYAHGDAELGTAINIENLPADQRVNTYDPSNPADRQAGFDASRATKVKLCQFFAQGNCRKGQLCSYAHGEAELGMPISAGIGAIDMMHNQFLPQAGMFGLDMNAGMGDLMGMGMMGTMGMGGGMASGIDLTGLGAMGGMAAMGGTMGTMGAMELPAQSFGSAELSSQQFTAGYGHGQPPSSADEPRKMPPKKVRLCNFYEQGRCAKGAACTFAHGEHEIGQPIDPGCKPGLPDHLRKAPRQDAGFGVGTMSDPAAMQSMQQALINQQGFSNGLPGAGGMMTSVGGMGGMDMPLGFR